MKTILYLTRNGLMEPLGRSQILPYLLDLSKEFKIIIISSEKEEDLLDSEKLMSLQEHINKKGIIWDYSKFNYGKFHILYSSLRYFIKGFFYCIRYKVSIIHCRSYLPNFLGVLLKLLTGQFLVFDMRGLWPEEIALGLPRGKKSYIYKILLLLEKLNMYSSDSIISLTKAAKFFLLNEYKIKQNRINVIPTCVDLSRFNHSEMPNSKVKKFSCIGTVISDWFLLDWLIKFFECVNEFDSNAEFEIITKDDKKRIYLNLKNNKNISEKINIKKAAPEEIPELLKNHSASAMFFNPGISKLGSSPTRFGEILATGRPIICNSGVGDLNKIIKVNKVGIIVKDKSKSAMQKAVKELYELISDNETSSRCRNLAESFYSLESGSEKYSMIYKSLLDQN